MKETTSDISCDFNILFLTFLDSQMFDKLRLEMQNRC